MRSFIVLTILVLALFHEQLHYYSIVIWSQCRQKYYTVTTQPVVEVMLIPIAIQTSHIDTLIRQLPVQRAEGHRLHRAWVVSSAKTNDALVNLLKRHQQEWHQMNETSLMHWKPYYRERLLSMRQKETLARQQQAISRLSEQWSCPFGRTKVYTPLCDYLSLLYATSMQYSKWLLTQPVSVDQLISDMEMIWVYSPQQTLPFHYAGWYDFIISLIRYVMEYVCGFFKTNRSALLDTNITIEYPV